MLQQILDDDTLSKLIVDSYSNGDIDEDLFSELFIQTLSELLFEKWVERIITESEESVVHGEISKEQKQTIISKVNSLWNTHIYKSVTEKNSKYKFSLFDLYNSDTIKQL
jgi:hypothetical protein